MRLKLLSLLTFGLTALSIQPANAYQSCTVASYYGKGDIYHGRQTANGERFNAYGLTAAHPHLPFGTRLRVTDRSSGRSVVIRVNDRGPYVGNRGLDLSYGAFRQITNPSRGLANVCYTRV
jgi:rare lipoprotein A